MVEEQERANDHQHHSISSITGTCSLNALAWIRPQFAPFASPAFYSKQERVSGVSAVSAVSAATLLSATLTRAATLMKETR
jgi:hypothetical protein